MYTGNVCSKRFVDGSRLRGGSLLDNWYTAVRQARHNTVVDPVIKHNASSHRSHVLRLAASRYRAPCTIRHLNGSIFSQSDCSTEELCVLTLTPGIYIKTWCVCFYNIREVPSLWDYAS